MVAEDSESNFGTTVRAFAFNGDETKFRAWEGKTLALAASKGFPLALTKEERQPGLTVEQFEYGEVEVPGVQPTGVPAGTGAVVPVVATTTRPTTAAENRKYLARAAAWTYLVASCTDKAYALMERAEGDPFLAWSILQEKYMATDAEENFPDLSEVFANCKLNETKKDPELWFNDLDHFNMRIGRINKKYEKDDLQMKSHIMTSMSSGYDPVVLKYRGELATTPLVKLRKEITLQYKALVKTGSKNKSESAMVANVNKHPYKKFKGTCRNCGKIGHKADECRSAKSETAVAVDKSNVTCFNCQEKGHYANKCTKPKKDKTAANDMAMFVGIAAVETGGTIIQATASSSTSSRGTLVDRFFDDWADDSWDEEHGFDDVGEFQPFYADTTATEDPVMVELEELPSAVAEEQLESVNVTAITEEFVGSVGVDGHESWLLDSGATCGVTYDKSNMLDMRASDKQITIGNGAKIATLGQGTVTLIDSLGNLVTLTDVYYAPKFTKHIVSLRKLTPIKARTLMLTRAAQSNGFATVDPIHMLD